MSDLILPPNVFALPEKPPEDTDVADTRKATQLPTPTGYKLLCVLPEVATTFENSNIIKADSSIRNEEHSTTVLLVVKMGPDAYKDKDKFPSGAWCREGDFVIVRTYSGTRVKIHGKEFRLLNDDQIDAVVEDPRGITRAAA